MAGDPRDRVSELYHGALRRAPDERPAYLEEACAGDLALRGEVESLLRFEHAAEGFLERSAADDAWLGRYRILAPLGAGGMGVVYRAQDPSLGRDVALKILPPHLAADPERRARFAREARLLATLSHPHIGTIHGFEDAGGIGALVLELVEGPTLAEQLARGALPIDVAIAIARQVCDALDAAHHKGIVHRDLKPANVVLQQAAEGPMAPPHVKVLDFGLAKVLVDEAPTDQAPAADSLEISAEGRILGTPAYMSPEQARGLPVDKRADVWAFGCMLFEMLAGDPPFEGETVSDTIARILERSPDWTRLPAATPSPVRRVLERCLRKDPHARLHDIADARLELDEPAAPDGSARVPSRAGTRVAWSIAAAGMLAALTMALLSSRATTPSATGPLQFAVTLPEGLRYNGPPSFAISPDGKRLAFTAAADGQRPMLWVRSLDSLDTKALPGTEGARGAFWRPDGRAIGYFWGNRLRTISVSGGSPVEVCQVLGSIPQDGAWNKRDVIVFGHGTGLLRVDAAGGEPRPLTTLAQGEAYHHAHSFLPDDTHFLYYVRRETFGEIRIGSLDTTETTTLGSFESHAAYAAGHLLFLRGGNLLAQPFDATARRLTGEAQPIGVEAGLDQQLNRGMFSVSSTTLTYVAVADQPTRLTWLTRRGQVLGTVGPPGVYYNVDLSPDDRRIATSKITERTQTTQPTDIWIIDVARDVATQFTDGPAWEWDPAWSPDGRRLAFMSAGRMFVRAADGTGVDVPIDAADTGELPVGPVWSPDGRRLIFTRGEMRVQRSDIWAVDAPPAGSPPIPRRATEIMATPAEEFYPALSPDGRWLAYNFGRGKSNVPDVYIRPYPSGGPVLQVSPEGGFYPLWRSNGTELFFVSKGVMTAASFDTARGVVGVPQALFPTRLRAGIAHPYDVSRDGQRFLLPMAGPPAPMNVLVNWPARILAP